ncbi:mucin-20 isoform 2-T2 [Thomomys bottae]
MGSTWGLALPLLLFCGDAGGFRSSAGPRTHGPVPLVTTNTTEVPAMPEGIKTRSEKTMDLQEPFMSYVSLQTQTLSSPTISKTLSTANNRSEVKSKGNRTTSRSARLRETPTISPLGENWTLSKIIAPTTVAGMTAPNETLTSRASGSPTGRGTPHRNGTRRDPTKATFSSPCTFDSSEEAHWITIDTSTEVESLSSENSSSSGSSVSRRNSSQALAPGTSTQAKALAAYRITHAEFTNCSITKETAAIISETSDTGPRPTEGEVALSTSESPASLPHSSEAEPFIPNTTALAEASSSASASVSAVLGADEVSNPRGTSVTITGKPLEGTSMLSFKTSNHTEVPEALPVSTAAGSTGGKVPSFAGSSASVYSPSDPVTIKDSTPSEKLTTASAADSRGPPSSSVHPATASTSSLPSAHPHTTASSQTPSLTSEGTFWTAHLHESSVPSQVPFLTQTPSTTTIPNTIITAATSSPETDTTFLKITASPVTPTRPPTSTSATLWSRQTMGVTADGDGGFLLVRLRVAYLEDLTEPSVVEKLMEQLHCELLAHKLLVQVSLLRVKRG